MTQAEAERLIVRRYREWSDETGTAIPNRQPEGGFVFFGWLSRHHPEALNFQCRGDKWQMVHIWLRKAGLVTQ